MEWTTSYSSSRALFLSSCLAGLVLCVFPIRAALSSPTVADAPQSAEPSTLHQAGQAFTTIVVDPDADAELQLALLLTDPMIEISSQRTCRFATVLAYFTVQDEVQSSIDLQTHQVDLSGTDSLGANADDSVDGKEFSTSIQVTPKNSIPWGQVTGLGDLAIQVTPL